MSSRIHSTPGLIAARCATVASVITASLAFALPAFAAASPPLQLTPFVDCVSYGGPANPIYTAYFGYNNTGPIPYTLAVGDFNNVFPGSQDAGQPTQFNQGNYPRAFAVQFDNYFIPTVTWSLNGIDVAASANSPRCTPGVTTPASSLAMASATLNGAVAPDGQDTTYSFEYGTSPSLGTSTPTQDAGAATQPQLVQANLTALTPSTQYYYRLDTTNALSGTTHGQLQSFTTPASSAPSSVVTASGATQTTTVGTAFASPLQAKVLDATGNPVPGVPVTFTAPSSGASATFAGGTISTVVPTDASGVATAPTLTAGATPGTYSVSATVAGVATQATFMLTNTPLPLVVRTTSAPHATFGTRYTENLSASGGTPGLTWSLTAGQLPAGLALTASSGVISGIPTAVGTSPFMVTVTDAGNPIPQTATQPLSITVDQAATTIHLVSSTNPGVSGRPVTYTATVAPSPAGAVTPTGNVVFTDNGKRVKCTRGIRPLDRAGVATCTSINHRPGLHTIIATYRGDADFLSSQSQAISELVTARRH